MRGAARHRTAGGRRSRPPPAAWGAAVLLGASLAGAAGCARASPAIQVASAYVPVPQAPGTTVGYVVIRNNGPADRLVAARTSVGGRVVFAVTYRAGAATRVLPSVRIPARATLAMDPGGVHMVITGAGPMRGGRDITLTLVFARAGKVTVITPVTDPAGGGGGLF